MSVPAEMPMIPYTAMIFSNSQVAGHTIYNLRVMAPTGQSWDLSKRYSHFHEMNEVLKTKYPVQLPPFPGKRLFGNSDPTFVQQRQAQLQHYLNGVLLLEPDIRTPIVAEFLEVVPPSNAAGGAAVVGAPGGGGGTAPTANPQNATSTGPPVISGTSTGKTNAGAAASGGAAGPPASGFTGQTGQQGAGGEQNLSPALAQQLESPPTPSSTSAADGGNYTTQSQTQSQIAEFHHRVATDDHRLYEYLETQTGQNSIEEKLEHLVGSAAMQFLDLAQTPQCVDQIEINFRQQRYAHLCSEFLKGKAESLPEAFRGEVAAVGDLKDLEHVEFVKGLKPDVGLCDPAKLIVGFLDGDFVGGGTGVGAAVADASSLCSKMAAKYKIVFVRHGESEWNLKNLFCGWYDADLSAAGVEEATKGGAAIKNSGLKFDQAYSSVLLRANKTLDIILEGAGQSGIPIEKTWRLNERHYGGLTGLDKAATVEKYGADQVQIWRRSFDTPPPAMGEDHEFYTAIRKDPRYEDLAADEFPSCESLELTIKRTMPFWENTIVPKMKEGKTILVAAHGNSLRGIVCHLDKMSNEEIMELNLPTGIPFVYELDENLKPVVSMQFLGDPETVAAAIEKVKNQTKKK
eukprot:g11930.t1